MKLLKRILRRIKRLFVKPRIFPMLPSFAESISGGDGSYLEICRAAVLSPDVFASFRQQPGYTTVLEHVSESQGRDYFCLLSPERRAHAILAEVAKNDVIGGPATMRLDSGLVISPTTLRYLKVADDLEKHFGSLDGMDIVEIGIGYGGQCRVLDAAFNLKSYTLVDLKPVVNLAEQFLSNFPLRCTVRFLTMNELEPRAYDLALSNYAFSELSRQLQETYSMKAVDQCKRGYITYNDIAPAGFQSMTGDEMCERFGGKIFPEEPLTHPRNKIIVWGAAV